MEDKELIEKMYQENLEEISEIYRKFIGVISQKNVNILRKKKGEKLSELTGIRDEILEKYYNGFTPTREDSEKLKMVFDNL